MPIDRRAFLGALALAPAALAGCAGGSASSSRAGGPATGPGGPDRGDPVPAGPAAAALRAFPLSADAEPALVFRAAAARPGEP